MDYKGQELAEWLFYYIIIGFGGVGWVYGWIEQDFSHVFWAWLVGLGLACVVSLSASMKDASSNLTHLCA